MPPVLKFQVSILTPTPPLRNISCKVESLKEEGGHDVNGGLLENICLNNASVYINNTDFFSIGSLKVSPLKVVRILYIMSYYV